MDDGSKRTGPAPVDTKPPRYPLHVELPQVAPEFGEDSAGHTLLHPPQLLLSLVVFTQLAPHARKPALQPHVPLWHPLFAPHVAVLDV